MRTNFLKCTFFHSLLEREIVFYVNKQPRISVKDILTELGRVISEEDRIVRKLRLVEVQAHRISSIIEEDMSADVMGQTSATST
jgi:hypothetical protein